MLPAPIIECSLNHRIEELLLKKVIVLPACRFRKAYFHWLNIILIYKVVFASSLETGGLGFFWFFNEHLNFGQVDSLKCMIR